MDTKNKNTENTKNSDMQKLFDDQNLFETSENIEIYQSFDSIGLRDDLLKGKFNLLTLYRYLCLRVRQTISRSTKSNRSNYKRKRCHSSKSIRNW